MRAINVAGHNVTVSTTYLLMDWKGAACLTTEVGAVERLDVLPMGSRPIHSVSVWACQCTTAHGPLKDDKMGGMSAPGAPKAPSSAWPSLHPSGTGKPPKISPEVELQA